MIQLVEGNDAGLGAGGGGIGAIHHEVIGAAGRGGDIKIVLGREHAHFAAGKAADAGAPVTLNGAGGIAGLGPRLVAVFVGITHGGQRIGEGGGQYGTVAFTFYPLQHGGHIARVAIEAVHVGTAPGSEQLIRGLGIAIDDRAVAPVLWGTDGCFAGLGRSGSGSKKAGGND